MFRDGVAVRPPVAACAAPVGVAEAAGGGGRQVCAGADEASIRGEAIHVEGVDDGAGGVAGRRGHPSKSLLISQN